MSSSFEFVASTTNIVPIYRLISAISPFGDNCYLNITPEGLCFSIVTHNICKVFLTLDKRLFSYYEFHPQKRGMLISNDDESQTQEDSPVTNVTINLDLKSLLETINIHIPSDSEQDADSITKCTLGYQTEGSPFILTFEDQCIVERCELATYDVGNKTTHIRKRKKRIMEPLVDNDNAEVYDQMVDDTSIFQLDSQKVIFEVTLKSSILYDALKDMNDLNTDNFILYCSSKGSVEHSNNKVMFISKSEDASIGYSRLIIPEKKPFLKSIGIFKPIFGRNDDNGETCTMGPSTDSVSSFYKFEYFSKIIKAIRLSKVIKVRKDLNGLTSFLILIGSTGALRGIKASNNHHTRAYHEKNEPLSGEQLFYGTSIEFITLESESDDSGIDTTISDESKYGYNNSMVEKLIHDEDNIKTIRITGDGRLVTIDDYFPPAKHTKPNSSNHEPHPRTSSPLRVTKELTRSLLGLSAGHQGENGDKSVQVDRSVTTKERDSEKDNEDEENGDALTGNKGIDGANGHDQSRKRRRKNKQKKKDVETVGGSIEIPLFI